MDQSQPMLTEIPSFLKQLARRITRGFYQVEDSLIIDMLVRNTCKCHSYFCNLPTNYSQSL